MASAAAAATAAGYGAAAATTAAGVGYGLFSYNRGNYLMDQKLHYGRFVAGNTLAVAQTGMYREDIADMTELTCKRMDVYHGLAGMIATILTALYCPGRLGLHTSPPPGWLMGLFMVNVAGCYVFLGLTMWFAMHASLRADSAATHMLTRCVRLPVPAQWMLDRARKFLSSYEEQPLREVLRIPFLRHRRGRNPVGDLKDGDADRRTRGGVNHMGDDVPQWYKVEKDTDAHYATEKLTKMPLDARAAVGTPEHFEVYREIQNEWWPYDVYCRLSIFLAFMHLTHCYCYHQLGHHLQETRSVFAVGTVILPVTVLQQLILTLDIVPANLLDATQFPWQRVGPLAPWFAYVGIALEYKRWYTDGGLALSAVMVYFSYVLHVIYTLQLLRLCAPDSKAPERAEVPGTSWWPGEWCIPSSFQHSIWLVAPPRFLGRGQVDLVGEMKAAAAGDGKGPEDRRGLPEPLSPRSEKRQDIHRALGKQGQSPAWFNVKVGLLSLVAAWVFLIVGYTVEIATQGTIHPSLLNAPGLPNNLRDPRYRPAKPGKTEPVEVGTGGALHGPARGIHSDHVERRLQEISNGAGSEVSLADVHELADHIERRLREGNLAGHSLSFREKHELAGRVRALVPYLGHIAGRGAAQTRKEMTKKAVVVPAALPLHAFASAATAPPPPWRVPVQWPALFEPRLLACGPHDLGGAASAVVLSRHGRGVLFKAPPAHGAAAAAAAAAVSAQHFSLEGAAKFGPLLSAAWDRAGLLLMTAAGAALECPSGGPLGGERLRCRALLGERLPLGANGKAFAGAVAVGRGADQAGLRAAVVYPGESAVTMFARASHSTASWLPTGEARIHAPATAASFADDGNTLLVAAKDGSVTRMDLGDGTLAAAAAVAAEHEDHHWQSVCDLPSRRVARLGLRPSSKAMAADWEPTLLFDQ